MKTFIKNITLVLLGLSLLTACEDTNEDKVFNEKVVQFASEQIDVELLKQPVQNDTIRFTVQLMSKPLDKDVQVTFNNIGGENVTAIEDEHYVVLNNSVTIPAGAMKATVDYAEVIHDHFMIEESATAKISISSESDIPPLNGYETLMVNMKKRNVCPLEYEDIEGIWEVNEVSDYDGALQPYEIELVHKAEDTMIVKGLWNFTIDGNHPDMIALVDLTPGAETFQIPEQDWTMSSDYGQVVVEEYNAPATLNTCEKMITTGYRIFVTAGNFDLITESVWNYVGPASKKKDIPFERMEEKKLN